VKQAGEIRSPREVIKIRPLIAGPSASLEQRPTTETGVNALLVEVRSEAIQLAMEVEAVPEEGVVEILASKGSDQSLDERVSTRHEGTDSSSSISRIRRFARQR
jgi:hypothetical protein